MLTNVPHRKDESWEIIGKRVGPRDVLLSKHLTTTHWRDVGTFFSQREVLTNSIINRLNVPY